MSHNGQNAKMAKHSRRMPAWLLGLLIAVVVFVAVLIVFSALGYGDDPVLESAGTLLR